MVMQTKFHAGGRSYPVECLGSVGDCNPIEHGGGYILRNDAEDRPRLEYFEGIEQVITRAWDLDLDDPTQTDQITVTLYRADLETSGERFLRDLNWVTWEEIASYTGQELSAFEASALDSVRARAQVACDVADHDGWLNLDGDPLELTLTELIARWRDL